MRGGYRRPSVKKSVKSRTSGRVIRTARRSVTPGYGKKGMWDGRKTQNGLHTILFMDGQRNPFVEEYPVMT